MARLYHHQFLLWIAVCLLTVGSLLSAAMIAPDRADLAEQQLTLMGMTADDLCGTPAGHDHHCPFCHLVPDTPVPAPADVISILRPCSAWHLARHLHRAAQARDHARSPRAPPATA